MASEVTDNGHSYIVVTVTSTVNSFVSERRFPLNITITELKRRCELLTGSDMANMQLELHTKDGQLVRRLDDDSSLLSSCGIQDGMRIHVIDTSPAGGMFEDISEVPKYEISDEKYSQRDDSLRAFKQKHQLGQFKPRLQSPENEDQMNTAVPEELTVNSRCEVKIPKQAMRRGTILFVGTTDFKPGVWVGIRYDEPLGKNDGSVDGKRYFECPPKYGGFVRPRDVVVGDFPEAAGEDVDEI